MACGDPIALDRVIYRALPSYKYVDRKSKEPKDIAFLLRPATEQFEAETYLSFGTDQDTARAGLTNVPYVCEISVADILALPYNLQVVEGEDTTRVRVSGMPLFGADDALALVIAKDLSRRSKTCR